MTTPSEPLYCEIPLTQGKFAKVDMCDFIQLSWYKWHARWSPPTRSFYATRNDVHFLTERRSPAQMHRQILGLEYGDKRQVDHINHDTLDNRRANLRIATAAQNARNKRLRVDSTTGLKGVFFQASSQRWHAYIRFNGKRMHLGCFDTKEKAHASYCEASQQFHGEFGSTS